MRVFVRSDFADWQKDESEKKKKPRTKIVKSSYCVLIGRRISETSNGFPAGTVQDI